ncbi:MAG TPA: HEAT repeat domain-containing protein [Anaerolineae bacterium]|nr:HEAT repeat domain-containing protein [Anaerolineae bacterium]
MIRFCPKCWNEVPLEAASCPTCSATLIEALSFTDKLIAALRHREPTRAGLAIDILTGWLHEPRAVEPLCELLDHATDAAILKQAATGLGRLSDRQAVPALARLLQDPSRAYVARCAAAEALGHIGGGEAQHALQVALHDSLTSIRTAAQQALTVRAFNEG